MQKIQVKGEPRPKLFSSLHGAIFGRFSSENNNYLISSRNFPLFWVFRCFHKFFSDLAKSVFFFDWWSLKDQARGEAYYSFSVQLISKTLLTRELKSGWFDWPMTFCFGSFSCLLLANRYHKENISEVSISQWKMTTNPFFTQGFLSQVTSIWSNLVKLLSECPNFNRNIKL